MKITDEMAKKSAVEFLSYRGERPFRVTRRGAELWEDYTEAMRFALTAALSAAPEAQELDGGRFEEWSLADFASQCRMQARDNLDPDYSRFMAELAKRLSAAPAVRVKEDMPQDVVNLVIAAREFWETAMDDSDECAALDSALEAFSRRVPYEN